MSERIQDGSAVPEDQVELNGRLSVKRRWFVLFALVIVVGLGINIRGGTMQSAAYRDQAFISADACVPIYEDGGTFPRTSLDCYRLESLEQQERQGRQLQPIGFAVAGAGALALIGFVVSQRSRKGDSNPDNGSGQPNVDARLTQLDELLASGSISQDEHREARLRILAE